MGMGLQVLTKLDQLEVQLTTTEHLPRSPGLARLHSQSIKLLEDVTIECLNEGHDLLESQGTAAPGAEVPLTDQCSPMNPLPSHNYTIQCYFW